MKYAIIHIADIHYKKEEPEGASLVIKAFIQDLKKQKESFADYRLYIVIAGDIISAGEDSEAYEKFSGEIDKELNKAGLVRDIGSLIATTNMISVRVLNLSHFGIDMSARFVTNSLQLGSDAINISTLGYKIYRGKKIKQKLEKRVNEITKDILNAFSRLNNSFDDSGAKNLLVSYVGEKSVNDYLQWITNRTSQRE